MIGKRTLAVLLAALAVAAGACSDDKEPIRIGAGGSGGDGGAGGTGGTGGGGPRPEGPELGASERLGAFLPAQPKAMLLGEEKPLLIVGTQGIAYDPTWFGRPAIEGDPDDPRGTHMAIAAGLLTVDTSTGAARVLTKDDGVPAMPYADLAANYGEETASIVDLDWIETDRRFVGAAWSLLLEGRLGDDGTWSFASVPLRAPGNEQNAVVFHVEAVGETIFAGGDQGLAIVSAENLEVRSWVDFGAPNRTIHAISAGVLQGEEVAAVLFGDSEAAAPSGMGIVHADGSFEPIAIPSRIFPTAVLVDELRVLFGVQVPGKVGAIYAWSQVEGAWSLHQVVSPLELVTDAYGYPVVPNALFYDKFRSELVVGGRIVEFTPGGPGGGVVTLGYTPGAGISSRARDLLPKNHPAFAELPWWVDSIAQDANGALFLAGRQLCSEHKARQLPVYKIERLGAPEDAVVARPWIDGVRSIAVDPVNGEAWLGLRSELPGMSCDGITVSQALCRLRADGSCQVTVPRVNVNADLFAPTPGVVDIAFGDAERNQVALATARDALFFQLGDDARALPTQFEPGLNLRHTSADWGDDDTLWIGSVIEWQSHEDDLVNHRGPHGLGWFQLNEVGIPTATKRYVRVPTDNTPSVDVGGLPSNMVYDVLALEGAARAAVALGVERGAIAYDHLPGEIAEGTESRGGVALIDGDTVAVVAAPDGAEMAEIVALARGEDGVIYALDAGEGIFTVDVAEASAKLWTKATWDGERALSLAVDASGRVAVGTTHGLHVFGADQGVTTAFAGMSSGYVWRVAFVEDGVLYAGTDEGLHRVAIGAAALPAKGPASMAPWPFALHDRPCDGAAGCACFTDAQCGYGSDCACVNGDAYACFCTEPDPCTAAPGEFGCLCDPSTTSSCLGDLVCATDDLGRSTCDNPPDTCGGVAGCRCGATPCAEGFVCNFVVGVCEAATGDACLADCSCDGAESTADGCMDGYHCVRVGFGNECHPSDGPTGCEADCSCTGEGTTGEGCYEGQECLISIDGSRSCSTPPNCEDNCSCSDAGSTEDGCHEGQECLLTIGGGGVCEFVTRG